MYKYLQAIMRVRACSDFILRYIYQFHLFQPPNKAKICSIQIGTSPQTIRVKLNKQHHQDTNEQHPAL